MILVGEDYLKSRYVIAFLAAIGLTFGQTLLDLKTQTKNVDFSKVLSVRPFPTGTTLPSVCNTGGMFFKIDAASGANLYGCVASNSWVVQGPGTTTVTGGTEVITLTTASGSPSATCTAPSATSLAKYYDTTAKTLWTCTDTNTWQLDLTVNPNATLLITGTVGTAAGTPPTGKVNVYSDSTLKGLSAKDDTGQITRTVKPTDCSGTGFISTINADGTVTCAAGSGLSTSSSLFGNWQKKTSAITGDSTDKTIYSVTIPGGTLGSAGNTCIHGQIGFEHSTGSGDVVWKLTYGSTSSFTLWVTAVAGLFSHEFYLCNDPGTTNSQQLTFPPSGYNSALGAEAYPQGGVTGVMASTMTEDSTVDKALKLTANASNTDQFTGHYWVINK
jgi:hypothetical protein